MVVLLLVGSVGLLFVGWAFDVNSVGRDGLWWFTFASCVVVCFLWLLNALLVMVRFSLVTVCWFGWVPFVCGLGGALGWFVFVWFSGLRYFVSWCCCWFVSALLPGMLRLVFGWGVSWLWVVAVVL